MDNKVKVESLTPEQEAKFPRYVDKWLSIGKDTTRANRSSAVDAIREIYDNAKQPFPKKIEWFDSPLQMIKTYKISDLSFCYGNMETWLSFYDFFLNECGLEQCKRVEPFIKLSEHCGWWMPFDEAIYISEKPMAIHMKGNVLHCDGAPAVAYGDGFEIYVLNGVRMPKNHVMTRAEDIDEKMVFDESNAEIRRELVRKVGIERICKNASVIESKSITMKVPVMAEPSVESLKMMADNITGNKHSIVLKDERIDYELLNLPFQKEQRRYLKMLNPSIKCYHIEGVPPETQTIDEALAFRNGTKETPRVLS